MKNKEFWKGAVAGALVVTCIGTGAFAGTGLAAKGTALGDRKCTSKLAYLEELIDRYYLGDKDEEKLQEGLYAGLLYGLDDPYSRYYTAEEYDSENSSNEGSYVGIGILMEKNKEGGVKIVECYEGGPGEKAGLEEGDIISAIDGEDITEDEVSDVADIVRNSDKDSVVLTVHREGEEDAMEITVPVTDVELPSVFHEMLDSKIGYIRITQFTGVTGEQYQEAFDDLQKQGMEKMIVDLRDNPGGLLDSVCDVLRKILPEGLIVYTEDKHGNREEEKCDGKNELRIPLAVLVNESSASASEIFAGAVKDYGMGTIVGTTTYGKGVAQTIQRTQAIAQAVEAHPDLDYTKAASMVLMDGLMQRVSTAEDDFQEMPLDKAGRLIASLARNATYEKRVRQDMKKKAELAFEQMETELMAAIKQHPELAGELHDVLERAREKVLADGED